MSTYDILSNRNINRSRAAVKLSIRRPDGSMVKLPNVLVGQHITEVGNNPVDAARALAMAGPSMAHELKRTIKGSVTKAGVTDGTLVASEVLRSFALAEGYTEDGADAIVENAIADAKPVEIPGQ